MITPVQVNTRLTEAPLTPCSLHIKYDYTEVLLVKGGSSQKHNYVGYIAQQKLAFLNINDLVDNVNYDIKCLLTIHRYSLVYMIQ